MISGDGVMMGYAFPVRVEAVYKAPEVPYVGLLKALDAVGKDQVYVTPSNRNNGGDHPAAFGVSYFQLRVNIKVWQVR